MNRLSGSRFNFLLICLTLLWLGLVNAQDPFGDALAPNSQLWKSFQDEMKTLEQAAHRVNSLLNNANHLKNPEDQDANPAENPLDVTVLASPDVLRNGIRTKPQESTTEEKPEEPMTDKAEKKQENSDGSSLLGGIRQQFNTPNLNNLGSFINSFGFFKNFPEPWWKGKNVCVEKSEKEEETSSGEKKIDKNFIIMGTGTFEHCKQTSGKYICTTVMSTPQSTKTVSTTYQCCEGYRRQADGCVQGEASSPPLADNKSDFHVDKNNYKKDDKSEPEYSPNKYAVPQKHHNSLNIDKSNEEQSFSSQSDEGNGRPRWLRKYFQSGWMKK